MLGRLLALTSIGLVVYWFRRDVKTLRNYEQTFVNTYALDYANQVIPSEYHNSTDPQLPAKLCGYSALRRNLVRSKPRFEIHPISFKKLRKPPAPLIAEVIRCTRRTAVIAAPSYNGHDCAYLLQFQQDDTPSFFIYRKFCFMDKKFHKIKRSVSQPEIEHPTATVKEDPNHSNEDNYPDFEGSLS